MVKTVQQFATNIAKNIEQVILGKSEVIDLLVVALLCEGHVLLQDVPGTGKTMLARSLAVRSFVSPSNRRSTLVITHHRYGTIASRSSSLPLVLSLKQDFLNR